MSALEFDEPPGMPVWRLIAGARKRAESPLSVPPIEARMELPVSRGLEDYRRICAFVPGSGRIPMTWPHTLAAPIHLQMVAHPDFPLPALGIVHTFNRIVQHQPIPDQATLAFTCRFEGSTPARTGVEVSLVTRAELDGELVWEGWTRFLSRAVPGTGEKREHDEPPSPTLTRSVSWALPPDLGRRFGRIAGDLNPIHLYPLTAKPFGFSRPIVHGMWSLARVLAELEEELPAGPLQVDVSFRKPVPLPSTVTLTSGWADERLVYALSRGRGRVCMSGDIGSPSGR